MGPRERCNQTLPVSVTRLLTQTLYMTVFLLCYASETLKKPSWTFEVRNKLLPPAIHRFYASGSKVYHLLYPKYPISLFLDPVPCQSEMEKSLTIAWCLNIY